MTFRARITTGIAAPALILGLAAADIPSDLNAIDPSIPAAASETVTGTTVIDPAVAIVPTSREWVSGDCPSFFALAMDAGWTWNDWPRLGGIIMPRESGCRPGALNKRGRDWSFGLLQINTYGTLWTRPIGYGTSKTLPELCDLTSRDDLFDPAVNLRCGRLLFELRGWNPWS